jgi:hypothetical protein
MIFSSMMPPTKPYEHSRENYSQIWKASIWGSFLFLPAMINFLFRDTSFAVGTALSAIFVFAIYILVNRRDSSYNALKFMIASFVVAATVIVHLLISNIILHDPSFNFMRAIYIIPVFLSILSILPFLSKILIENNGPSLKTAQFICLIYMLISIMSLMKIQPSTESYGEKPIFPYTEPSFFAFSIGALLIYTVTLSPRFIKVTILLISFTVGYLLSNLTIIMACILVSLISLPTYLLIVMASTFFLVQTNFDFTYYYDRLNFDWERSFNISTLVYVQGWQLIEESLIKTWGWGVGFQQLGVVSNNVLASFRIVSLLGRDANILDGGFILSKLLSEFGIFGILLSAVYSWIAIRGFFTLRRVATKKDYRSGSEVFAYSCIVGYSIELFVRGSSYFTGTFVLLLASLLYLWRQRVVREFSHNPVYQNT